MDSALPELPLLPLDGDALQLHGGVVGATLRVVVDSERVVDNVILGDRAIVGKICLAPQSQDSVVHGLVVVFQGLLGHQEPLGLFGLECASGERILHLLAHGTALPEVHVDVLGSGGTEGRRLLRVAAPLARTHVSLAVNRWNDQLVRARVRDGLDRLARGSDGDLSHVLRVGEVLQHEARARLRSRGPEGPRAEGEHMRPQRESAEDCLFETGE